MSAPTYFPMSTNDKQLVWLHGEVKSPPFSLVARRETGLLLRLLQQGHDLVLPHARPMPRLGPRCHELRINDHGRAWRILLRIDRRAILILHVFDKKTPTTPHRVVDACKDRLRRYDMTAHLPRY